MPYVRGHLRSNGWFRRRTYVRPHYRRNRRTNELVLVGILAVVLVVTWIIVAR